MRHLTRTGRVAAKAILAMVIAVGLAGCSSDLSGKADDTVIVYRGLDAKPNGQAKTSPSQFRFNPDMSTFDAPPATKPCAYAFVSLDGNVQGMQGYTAAQTPPPGHWSIDHPANVTADQAKAAAAAYALANPNGFTPAACVPS